MELDGEGLGPMDWESQANEPPVILRAYRFFEDFAEWLVLGCKAGLKSVGLPVVSGLSLLVKLALISVLACAIVWLGIWMGHAFGTAGTLDADAPSPTRKPVVRAVDNQPGGPARDLLADYFQALNQKRYSVAYDDLSPAWKGELPYQKFADTYQSMENLVGTISKITQVNPQKYEVEVDLSVKLAGAARQYHGIYVAVQTDDGWKIDSGVVK